MGKILVKSPAIAAPLSAALGNTVQDAFKVKTPFGRGVGGALGGISALTSLADASENQQDAFSAAQMAAGRGVGTYIGAGKAADTAAPVYDKAKTAVGQTAARLDPRKVPSQQVGVVPRNERPSRGQVERFKNQDFGAGLPEDFQLGMLGTSMGGGNYVTPKVQGIQPNLFSQKNTTMDTTNVTAPPTNLSYQVPTAQTMAANEPRPQIGATQESYGYPSGPLPNPNPVTNTNLVTNPPPESSVDATAEYYATLSPEVQQMIMNQKTAGEPMELAFMLLKSVMR